MGDEQRVSWQELLAQSRDDFEAGTDFTLAVTFRSVGRRVLAYQHTPERRKASTENESLGFNGLLPSEIVIEPNVCFDRSEELFSIFAWRK